MTGFRSGIVTTHLPMASQRRVNAASETLYSPGQGRVASVMETVPKVMCTKGSITTAANTMYLSTVKRYAYSDVTVNGVVPWMGTPAAGCRVGFGLYEVRQDDDDKIRMYLVTSVMSADGGSADFDAQAVMGRNKFYVLAVLSFDAQTWTDSIAMTIDPSLGSVATTVGVVNGIAGFDPVIDTSRTGGHDHRVEYTGTFVFHATISENTQSSVYIY